MKERYNFMRPFLCLINHYFMWDNLDERKLFSDDGMSPGDKITCKYLCAYVLRIVIYVLMRIRFRKKVRGNQILISNLFLWLDRYDDVIGEILNRNDVLGMISCSNCSVHQSMNLSELDKKRFYIMRLPVGTGVSRRKTKKAVLKLYRAMLEPQSGQSVNKLMKRAERRLDKDIQRMVRVLKAVKVVQYITINEYYLKEYIIIAACKRLGIEVKLLHHHIHLVERIPEEKRQIFSYADKMYFWTEDDLLWCKRHCEYLGIDSELEYKSCGSSELCAKDMKKALTENPKKESILLLMPGVLYFILGSYTDENSITMDQYRAAAEIRLQIIENVYKLAQKEHLQFCLRYHPNEHETIKKMEKDMLEKCGVLINSGGADQLKKVLCESQCVISGETSALFLASAYGASCYCVATQGNRFDFGHRSGIEVVSVEEIGGINVWKKNNKPHFEYCLDYDYLFRT